jgi:hypothetical protein
LRLRGVLDIPALERGLNEIVRRHEVLRTVFAGEADPLGQVVLPVTPIELPVSGIAAEDAVREAIAEFRRRRVLAFPAAGTGLEFGVRLCGGSG